MNTYLNERSSWRFVGFIAAFAVMTLLMLTHQFAQASDDRDSELRGVITAKPAIGKVGIWTIGGKDFQADARTKIEQENGLLAIGSCAKVEYKQVDATNKALKIERKRPQECGLPGSTIPRPTPQPVNACDDDNEGDDAARDGGKESKCKVVGRLTSMPESGLLGIWGIDTVSYTVNMNSDLHTSKGMFVINACVKAEYTQNGADLVIKTMHTTHAFRCDGDLDDNGRHDGEMFGIIESFPLSATGVLTGEWVIGGKTFVADNTTEFKQEKVKFGEGVMVKVKFWSDVNDVNYAMKIETKFRPEHDGEDHDNNGSHDGAEGMAAGKVITIPESRIGVWVIGALEYTTDSETKFEEKRGVAAVGTVVRVRYHLDADGARIADSIKTLALAGQPSAYEDAHLVGPVEVMPSDGFSGTWQIAGETFVTTDASRFEEERGVLAVGAYVRVEFVVVDGVKQIVELKTLVAPGAGENNEVGTVEQNDDESPTLSAAGVAATGTWVIGGKSYVITDGTVVSTDSGTLNVGDSAVVNSYTAADGTQVATKVEGVTLNNKVYLPSISR